MGKPSSCKFKAMPIQPVVLLSLSLLLFSCAAPANVSDTPRPEIVLSGDEGDQILFPIHPTRRLASSAASESGLSVFELTVPPHSAGAPPHTHMYEDEFFYVRKGSPTFTAGGVRRTVDAGGFVLLPRNGAHAFWNDSEEEAILLAGTSNGKFDDFFDTVAL